MCLRWLGLNNGQILEEIANRDPNPEQILRMMLVALGFAHFFFSMRYLRAADEGGQDDDRYEEYSANEHNKDDLHAGSFLDPYTGCCHTLGTLNGISG